MNITIVGAGNMGLCLLGYLAGHGHNIILYTTSHKLDNKTLIIRNHEQKEENVITQFKVTSSIKKSFSNCDIVFCTYPAFLRKEFIKEIEDILNPGSILCFIPGYGGAEYHCKRLLSRGVKICGFQRVPYVARYEEIDGYVLANILSVKKQLFIATIPKKLSLGIAGIIENLLNIPTVPLDEYLAVTLSPSNPLLHISGLYGVFGTSTKETIFSEELKFYEEWNDATSRFLFRYDEELHRICNSMSPLFNLKEVVPLAVYYESPTPQDMTRKLKSIESFKVVKVPLKRVGALDYRVDIDSRMFVEDFPFGVCMFKAFALLVGIDTPLIDKLLQFYSNLSGKRYFKQDGSFDVDIAETGIPQLCGISDLNDLKDFYLWDKDR